MCRREVMDDFLRKRAEGLGAKLVNGLLLRMEQPEGPQGPIKIHYNDYAAGDGKVGKPSSMEVDMVSSDSFVFFPSELVVRESVQGEAVSTFPKTLTFSSPPSASPSLGYRRRRRQLPHRQGDRRRRVRLRDRVPGAHPDPGRQDGVLHRPRGNVRRRRCVPRLLRVGVPQVRPRRCR